MSTLAYLDPSDGSIRYTYVPEPVLHDWLSKLNGNTHLAGSLQEGVNRGKVLEELESRRNRTKMSVIAMGSGMVGRDLGYGRDWREYENEQGYTHLEELLIYQPLDWRKQAREYLYRFSCDLERVSKSSKKRLISMSFPTKNKEDRVLVVLESPVCVVLFHRELARCLRYEPLNFLLSYGVHNPMPRILELIGGELTEKGAELFKEEVSPLDYFFAFQDHVLSYKLDFLRQVGQQANTPRLWLLKEFDFSNIVGQRLAKQMVRSSVFHHIWHQSRKNEMCGNRKPLSMIFAGPSGTGKTELAIWLKTLLNRPGDDNYLKVDMGSLSDKDELLGMSGAYQGAREGSALNNFVLRMSLEPESLGIVLLDEIEKASGGVIEGLYQVLDKGEWTNKKLEQGKTQSEIVSCHNIIFIMTTNAADKLICDHVKSAGKAAYTVRGPDEVDDFLSRFESLVKKKLQKTYPFTDAFMGRVGAVVPFLPMANGDPDEHLLLGESMTIAKLLIEREQDKLSMAHGSIGVKQMVSASTKQKMAKIIVKDAIVESGVRSIQQGVEKRMGNRMMEALAREEQSIQVGAQVCYSASEEDKKIDFRIQEFGKKQAPVDDTENWENSDDLFG